MSGKAQADFVAILQPEESELCTESFFFYATTHYEVFDFLFFGTNLAVKMDEFRLSTAEAAAELGNTDAAAFLASAAEGKGLVFSKYKGFAAFQSENICIRLVDNFVTFLSEIIQACILSRPEMLRSKEQITLEEVFQFSDYGELTKFITEKKINELAYGKISDIEKFLKKPLGIELFSSTLESDQTSVFILLRNIYTHERGHVNDLFLKRIANVAHMFEFKKGRRFVLNYEELKLFGDNLFCIAKRLNSSSIRKFNLSSITFSQFQAQAEELRAEHLRNTG